MRARYESTSPFDVTRPAVIASCNSTIDCSYTSNRCGAATAGGGCDRARDCASSEIAAADIEHASAADIAIERVIGGYFGTGTCVNAGPGCETKASAVAMCGKACRYSFSQRSAKRSALCLATSAQTLPPNPAPNALAANAPP